MLPRRFEHFIFAVIQSGLTCAIASAVASVPFLANGSFALHWLQSWAIAWFTMLPVVVFAAPAIRRISHALTREEKR